MAEDTHNDEPTVGSTQSLFQGESGETLDSLEEKGERLFNDDKKKAFDSLLAEGRFYLLGLEQTNIEGDTRTVTIELSAALHEYCRVKQTLEQMIRDST